MRALSVDFGTCNTVAMLTGAGAGATRRPLLLDGSPLMPSAVYLDEHGQLRTGRDAQRHARADPARFEPSPKRRVDDGSILLGDTEVPLARAFAAVLARVAGEARRQLGGPPGQVRLTHPARWGRRRRALLVEAAGLAGLTGPRLIAEPVAAASYFTAILRAAIPDGGCLAIYDLGGGTFDATVVRRTPAGFDVLAQDGLVDVGGLDFDHAIVEHLGRLHRDRHPRAWTELTSPRDAAARRARMMFHDEVRAAKEALSRTSDAPVALPLLDVDAHLTRAELEELIRPHLLRTVHCLARTIAAAGLAAPDLAGVFLVGGSSRIPLAAHLIHSELRVAPTTLEQPETVVAEGALCVVPAPAGAGPVPARAAAPGNSAAHPPAPARPDPLGLPDRPGLAVPAGGPAGRPAHDRVRTATIVVAVLVVALAVVLIVLLAAG